MTKVTAYLKEHKRILTIALLLVLLIALAFLLFGGSAKVRQTSADVGRTQTETKLMRVLSEIDGVGRAEVMVTEGENGVEGVIIVCEGASSLMTRNDILNAVKTALNVEKNNIAIYAMNK